MTASIEQQLKRIRTIVAATSYRFPIDDAKGFPNALPPARKIGLARRSLTGQLNSATKVDGPGPFESSLERDYYVLLEFDPKVAFWFPQSIRVEADVGKPAKRREYFPDVLVQIDVRQNDRVADRFELCEIKFREQIRKDWETLKPKFKACRAYARERNWKFRILTEVEIRTPRLFNAKFLLPYLGREFDLDCQARVFDAMRNLRSSTPAELLDSMTNSLWERAALLPSLWALLGTGGIDVDLDRRLTMQSLIKSRD